ncbi:MAG: hypothetical protein ACP5QE_05255 [Conexivisphaera sp.]
MKTAKISLAVILPVLFMLAVTSTPLLMAAAPAHAASASITASPSPVCVKTPFTLNGSGFEYNALVTIKIINSSGVVVNTSTVVTNSSGVFSTPLTAPSVPGTYTITATDGVNYASTTLTVLHAYITVAPTTYYLGVSDVVVTGAGFEPNTNVNVSIYSSTGLVNSKIVTTSSTGGFSYTFVQNFTASGAYIVNATDGICSPSQTITVLPPTVTVTPTRICHCGTITVAGDHFYPNSTITVKLVSGSKTYYTDTTTAGITGNFTLPIPLPSNATAGNYNVTATDAFGNIASQTITVEYANVTATINGSGDAGTTFTVTVTGVGFEPNAKVTINASYVMPYSNVKVSNMTTATASSSGSFTATLQIVLYRSGTYNLAVKATDGICSPSSYTNDVTVDPRLVVTPSSVIPGEAINVTGYGFTPTYTANVTWIGEGIGYHNLEVLVKNLSINNIGEFSATAKIPSPVYGGVHYVFANDTKNVNASAEVYVNPSITLSPSTASLGSSVTVTLNGLMVGQENWTTPVNATLGSGINITDKYLIAQDNIPTYVYNLTGNPYGYATYTISATGYPMLHAIQLVNQTTLPYKLVATAWLNIIGTTNTETALSTQLSDVNASLSNRISSAQSSISTQLSDVNASLSNRISSAQSSMSTQLTNLQGTLMNILSSLTSLQTAVGNLGSTLNSDYNSLSSSLSSVSSSLSSMSSTLSSVSSQVGAIGSSLSSMSSTLSSVQSEAAQISSVNSLALATIVIAIIVLVLEIVVLIRRR